jgi:hypothetical protein
MHDPESFADRLGQRRELKKCVGVDVSAVDDRPHTGAMRGRVRRVAEVHHPDRQAGHAADLMRHGSVFVAQFLERAPDIVSVDCHGASYEIRNRTSIACGATLDSGARRHCGLP